MKPALYPCLLAALLWAAPLVAQSQSEDQVSGSTNQLVRAVIDNEIQAEQSDNTRWFYRMDETKGGHRDIKDVIETSGGSLSLVLEQDGNPLTPEALKQEEENLERMASDPRQMQKRKQTASSDAEKAQRLMRMLPDAFLYQEDGTDENGLLRLKFSPNPDFNPPTREAKVFHSMAGTLLVDPKEKRVAGISGTLIRDVNFGWGILGVLHKGGTFEVKRAQVAPGIWKETVTDVHISGHAIFFKTINEQQHEVHTDFHEMPENITPPEAAQVLKQRAEEASGIKNASNTLPR
jgi:hypothetical protein